MEGGLQNSSLITTTSRAILSNGSLLAFIISNPACNSAVGSINNTCGWVDVDVNGFRGPNIIGRDIFFIWFTGDGILPFGSYSDNMECISGGNGCATKVLLNQNY